MWLANIGSRSAGGLSAGSVITTGSLTGITLVNPPVSLEADLPGLGTVRITIE